MADEEHWTHGYCGTSGLFSALQFALLNKKDPKVSVVQLDRSPAFLTSDNFIRSNEIFRTKWPIYVVISHFVLMMILDKGKIFYQTSTEKRI